MKLEQSCFPNRDGGQRTKFQPRVTLKMEPQSPFLLHLAVYIFPHFGHCHCRNNTIRLLTRKKDALALRKNVVEYHRPPRLRVSSPPKTPAQSTSKNKSPKNLTRCDLNSYVVLVALGVIPVLSFVQGSVAGGKRKTAKVPYPNMYATREEMKANKDAYRFNCAQRAHGNL
jgi:hypothetical protein